MALIDVVNMKKSFGTNEVLKQITFQVEKNEVVAVIGPSGSGKSTMLRSLAQLEVIEGGSITVGGQPLVTDGNYAGPAETRKIGRRIGMVFQHFNLFPHLTVRQNLALAPKLVKGEAKEKLTGRTMELLEKVGLADKIDAYPGSLSGGQKQRVAIARALMMDPEILLFDEPTSALDPELTGEVLAVMKKLAHENMTMIVVTHEMSFAKDVATKALFMADGEIVEEGVPAEMLTNPTHARTKLFLARTLG